MAQFIVLFQAMDYLKSGVTRLLFAVGFRRGNEASDTSSKEILKLITKLDMLPQIILATIDYEAFEKELPTPAQTIVLTEQRKLLSNEIYSKNCVEIESLLELLKKV